MAVSIDYSLQMDNVTKILFDIESGDPAAADALLPLVYDQLRRLASLSICRRNCTATGPMNRKLNTIIQHRAFTTTQDLSGVEFVPPSGDTKDH